MKMRFPVCTTIVMLLLIVFAAEAQVGYTQTGNGSYYGKKFHGRRTASGERYNMYELTAAHPRLEFGTLVKVTNLQNNRSVTVRINDRGPFKSSRIIDVSRAAAKELGMIEKGIVRMRLEVVDDSEPVTVSEDDVKTEEQKNDVRENSSEPSDRDSDFSPGRSYSLWGTVKYPRGVGVQIGSFNDLHNAQVFVKEVMKEGFDDIYITSLGRPGDPLFRILVGDFSDREEAIDQQKKLKKAGFNGFIKTHTDE